MDLCNGTMLWVQRNHFADGHCGLTDGSEAGDCRLPTKAEWEAFMSKVYDNPSLVGRRGVYRSAIKYVLVDH